MVVQVLKVKAELDKVETLEFPSDHEWTVDVRLPQTGEERQKVVIRSGEEFEVPNSRGSANVVLKVEGGVYATISIVEIPKLLRNTYTQGDSDEGSRVPIIAFECRGCELIKWHPTGYYRITTPEGTVFSEVDLSSGEWYEVDSESNLPVSVVSIDSCLEVYRKMKEPVHIPTWILDNEQSFCPPICNKLLYRNLLNIMFVGGPNSRSDFHVDESSEFFYQICGNMKLPIVEQGKFRIIEIKEGEVFLLPSRIPHSPQRHEKYSVGLVLERMRDIGSEYDCMRWYTDDPEDTEASLNVQFEKYFKCSDLGTDLVPVVEEYKLFLKNELKNKTGFEQDTNPLIASDHVTIVPSPFNLKDWISSKRDLLDQGESISLFGDDHPDKEFFVQISSLMTQKVSALTYETFIHQVEGSISIVNKSSLETHSLGEGSAFILPKGTEWIIDRKEPKMSLTMIVHCDPLGNKN